MGKSALADPVIYAFPAASTAMAFAWLVSLPPRLLKKTSHIAIRFQTILSNREVATYFRS